MYLFGLEKRQVRRVLLQVAQLEAQIPFLKVLAPLVEALCQVPICHVGFLLVYTHVHVWCRWNSGPQQVTDLFN